jgi:hypothetical protein
MFFICETRDGSPTVVAGPCWPFCTFITVPLIVVLSGLTLWFFILDKNSVLVSIEMGYLKKNELKINSIQCNATNNGLSVDLSQK